MVEAIILFVSFLLTSLTAMTIVPSLPLPLAYTPLILITGLLVMHRVGVGPGIAWIVVGALILEVRGITPGHILPLTVAAGIAFMLVERVFATRSVYALLGLGLVTGLTSVIVYSMVQLVNGMINEMPVSLSSLIQQSLWLLILLEVGLYLSFTGIVTIRSSMRNIFMMR